MRINLNKSSEFTIESLQNLIANTDDKTRSQIRVTKDGYLFISKETGGDNLANILFRLETFQAGNGYVGPEAAADIRFVERLFTAISQNWPNPTMPYIDSF
jgi:hypothetical protein